MGVYRIEIASSGRAICKNTECKKNQVKIPKDDLRFCTQVDINGKQSWTYKHWGCTTPQQIQNLKDSIEDNIEYVDGLNELPSDLQAKVLKALEEGHVEDTDWKGDVEQNRPGKTGFRSPAVKKSKAKGVEDEEADANLTSSKSASTKRRRIKKSDDLEEEDHNEPVSKKVKVDPKRETSSKATDTKGDSDVGASLQPKRRGKGKKANNKSNGEAMANEEETVPLEDKTELPPKQKRPERRAAALARDAVFDQSADEMNNENFEEQENGAGSKPRKSRKKAAENSSGTNAHILPKPKKVGSTNAKAAENTEKILKSNGRGSRRKVA